MHNLFENAQWTQLGTAGRYDDAGIGTGQWLPVRNFEYTSVVWQGTGAVGTFNVYKATDSSGGSAVVINTIVTTAAGTAWGVDVKSDTLPSAGTPYNHITAAGTPVSGGTISGALWTIRYAQRTSPGTHGFTSYGTVLY